MIKVKVLDCDTGGIKIAPKTIEVFSFWSTEDADEGRRWGISFQESRDVGFITSDERALDEQEVISEILRYHKDEGAQLVLFYREDCDSTFKVLLENNKTFDLID